MPRGLLKFLAAVSAATAWVAAMNIIATQVSEPVWVPIGAASVVVMVRSLLDLAERKGGQDG